MVIVASLQRHLEFAADLNARPRREDRRLQAVVAAALSSQTTTTLPLVICVNVGAPAALVVAGIRAPTATERSAVRVVEIQEDEALAEMPLL